MPVVDFLTKSVKYYLENKKERYAILNYQEFSLEAQLKEKIDVELLEVAIEERKYEFIKTVLETGFRCDLQDEDGNTMLHRHADASLTTLVLAAPNRGNLNLRNADGETIVDIHKYKGSHSTVRELEKAGATASPPSDDEDN